MLMRCRWSKEWTCTLVIFILNRLRTNYFLTIVIIALLVIFLSLCACAYMNVCVCAHVPVFSESFPCNFRLKTAQFLPKPPLSLYLLFPSRWPLYFPLDVFLLSLRARGGGPARQGCRPGLCSGAGAECSAQPAPGESRPVPGASRSRAGLPGRDLLRNLPWQWVPRQGWRRRGVLNGPWTPGVTEDARARFWSWLRWSQSRLTPLLRQ